MDIDTYNTIKREEAGYLEAVKNEKNAILKMTNSQKKQARWNELFPKLAIDGLSAEDLARPW